MFNRITFLLILITFATYAASGYLQNEDFKTESELLTAGGSKSQLLNDTKVYVTGNGINKTLDDAIIDGDIGAGGGDAGINFIVDASFEKETFAPTDSLGTGTATYPLFTTNDKLYSEFNTKYYQVAHTGLSAANYSVNYSQARTGLDGKQGLFSIWAKVNADLDLCIELDASSTCESTVSLIADDTWRKYEIPFVFGASSVEFNFFNASLTGDITLQLDKAYIGVIPDGYIQDVGQASFVGDINFNSTGCLWTINTGTGFQSFPVNASCSYQTRGNVLAPDTKIPAVKIPNARTDGYYKVVLNGFFGVTQGNVADVCSFNLSDSTGQNDNGGFAFTQTSPGTTFDSNRFANEITGQFKFTTSGDKTIQVLGRPDTSGDSCSIFADAAIYGGTISVHFFPDDNSTIVSQNIELTAQTANEFSAGVLSVGTTERENFDWIDGNCVRSGASNETTTCNFVSGLFSNTPNCSCTARGGNTTNGTCNVENGSTTKDKIVYNTFLNNIATSSGVELKCSRSTDYNKSATIIGKFESINSSDLISIAQTDVTAQSVNDATDTEIDGISYTITKASRYYIDAVSTLQTNATGYFRVDITKNTSVVSNYFVCNKENTNWISCRNNYIGNFEVGDVVKISVVQGTGGARNVNLSKLTIQELPDTESIIKNLSQEKTKCQTKYLSADVTANGTSDNTDPSYIATLDSIEFNNLTVGKRYSVNSYAVMAVNSDSSIVLEINNGSKNIVRNIIGNSNGASNITGSSVGNFIATNSTLSVKTVGWNNTSQILYGNGTRRETNVTLCQLPDSYVDYAGW